MNAASHRFARRCGATVQTVMHSIAGKPPLLFTPGPLTTGVSTKEAMLRDLGSRDGTFIEMVRDIRQRLLQIAGVSKERGFETILMQGSGTFGLESVVSSTVPRGGRMLVLANGAYGERIVTMARMLHIDVRVIRFAENTPIHVVSVRQALDEDAGITHVSAVHCETTTGLLNPIEELGTVVRDAGCHYFVDAMSSLGGMPLHMESAGIDFLVTSANKCLEGVPGFSIVLARRSALLATEGGARSLSLDLHAQWRGLEHNGQFRFTPPTHTLLALDQALRDMEAEGGVSGRAARYKANHAQLVGGMQEIGFKVYLAPEHRSHIITSFRCPDHPSFVFETFYRKLGRKGFVVYPGKLTHADTFRIGSIGQVFPHDINQLIKAIRETLEEMHVTFRPALASA